MPIAGLGAFLFFTPETPSVPVIVEAPQQAAAKPWRPTQAGDGGFPAIVVAAAVAFAPDAPTAQRARQVQPQATVDAIPPSASAAGWDSSPAVTRPAKPIQRQTLPEFAPYSELPVAWFTDQTAQPPAKPIARQSPDFVAFSRLPIAWFTDQTSQLVPWRWPHWGQLPVEIVPGQTAPWDFAPAVAQPPAKPIPQQRPIDATPPINVSTPSGWGQEPSQARAPRRQVATTDASWAASGSAPAWWADVAPTVARSRAVAVPSPDVAPPSVGVWNFLRDIVQAPAKSIVVQRPIEVPPPLNTQAASGWFFDGLGRPFRAPRAVFPTDPPASLFAGWVDVFSPAPRGRPASQAPPPEAFPATAAAPAVTAYSDVAYQRAFVRGKAQADPGQIPPIVVRVGGYESPPQFPPSAVPGQRRAATSADVASWGTPPRFALVGGFDTWLPAKRAPAPLSIPGDVVASAARPAGFEPVWTPARVGNIRRSLVPEVVAAAPPVAGFDAPAWISAPAARQQTTQEVPSGLATTWWFDATVSSQRTRRVQPQDSSEVFRGAVAPPVSWAPDPFAFRPARPSTQQTLFSFDPIPTLFVFGPVSADRIIVVASDGRIVSVAFDERTAVSAADTRFAVVALEDRTEIASPDTRTLVVKKDT